MTEPTRILRVDPTTPVTVIEIACQSRARSCWLAVVLLTWTCGFTGQVAFGQDQTPAPAAGPQPTGQQVADQKPAGREVAVSKVVSVRSERNHPDRAGLDDVIFVKVTNLDALLKQKPIMLYLNGKAAPLEEPQVYQHEEELAFRLMASKTDVAEDFWMRLLQPITFTRRVEVSVGPAERALEEENRPVTMTLIVIPVGSFYTWLIMFVCLVIMVIFLAKKTKMLRDSGVPGDTGGTWNRYSLSRTQMAFWFVLIVGSFGFIWLITGKVDTLTSSVVALAGISAATALGAVTVDAGKEAAATAELADSLQQQQYLQGSVAALDAATTQGAAIDPVAVQKKGECRAKLDMLDKKMVALKKKATVPPCESFWKDILSDANGISLNRLQIAVWTIVLGIIFVHDVYNRLSMPEFSSTLLGLMGVSSGTYIGFKFPEQKQ